MNRALAGLVAAEAVSVTGTRMSMVALPWFVLDSTGSAVRTGVVAFAEMTPYVLASVLAAPVTDRVGPRRTSVVCDLGSAAAVVLVPLLHLAGVLSFPALLGLVALAGALRGPGDNAKYVLIPLTVRDGSVPLERAAAIGDGANRVAALVGAPLAGALVGVFGAADILFIDAATFLVAALLIAGTAPRRGKVPDGEDDGAGYLHRLGFGLRFARSQPLLLAIAGMLLLTNLLDQAMFSVLLPVWARDEAHGALGVGLVAGAMGLGAALGALVMVAVGARVPRRRTFLLCFLIAGAPRFGALALGVPLPVALAVVLVAGLAAGALNPILTTVEMERIPEQVRSRVLATMTAIAWGGIPLGGLVGGWLVGGLGVYTALAICAGVYLLATFAPLGQTWADMDRRPAAVATGEPLPVDGCA